MHVMSHKNIRLGQPVYLAFRECAQHSVPKDHWDNNALDPRKNTETMVVGVCAFSSRLRGFKWVPSKRRSLVPPTSRVTRAVRLPRLRNGETSEESRLLS
jgi:hypothetical protein